VPERPRALVVTPDFPPEPGGIQVLVHRVASALTAFDVRVVAINDEGAGPYDAASDLDTVRAGRPELPNRANVALLNALALREGLAFRPDVILNAHMVCAPAVAALARLRDVPSALYVYADELSATPKVAAYAMQGADRIIVISRHTRELAIHFGGDPARMELILPGVDVPPPPQRTPAERPTVLTIASQVKRYKGHDVMIRALPLIRARVPDARWVVVGTGPLQAVHEQLVREAGLQDCVDFRGRVSAEERDAWLNSAHVLAMPSRLRPEGGGGEGFGIVYLEAGAYGIPAVGGNVAGALDAVVDGETGLLVDPKDHVALANAIADLLLDPDRAARMGAAGRAWAERHAWPLVGERVQRLLLETVRA
jgi:phosphatidylinositol alpha-1,6-mannosyltransferase